MKKKRRYILKPVKVENSAGCLNTQDKHDVKSVTSLHTSNNQLKNIMEKKSFHDSSKYTLGIKLTTTTKNEPDLYEEIYKTLFKGIILNLSLFTVCFLPNIY